MTKSARKRAETEREISQLTARSNCTGHVITELEEEEKLDSHTKLRLRCEQVIYHISVFLIMMPCSLARTYYSSKRLVTTNEASQCHNSGHTLNLHRCENLNVKAIPSPPTPPPDV
jgi:hypothetical protein